MGEIPEGIAKDGRGFAGLHATELDAAIFDAAIGGFGRGRRTKIHRARHATAGGVAAEIGFFAVNAERQRVRAVHILFNYRPPVVGQVPR